MRFPPCEICSSIDWTEVYRGQVRDGVFGSYRADSVVQRCGGCGAERLGEEACIPESYYETQAYRSKLRQGLGSKAYFEGHDDLQIHTLGVIWPPKLRDAVVADVGCAAGSLLDHLRGISRQQIGIEPSEMYRASLTARGYEVYRYATDAAAAWAGRVDLALSIQVIEHTSHPRRFLEEIRPLLRPGGSLVISTPNRRDILFDLMADEFPSFFYRVVHRWYFDAASLAECARLAGFDVEIRYVHRYGMSNALRWLRDRKPTGDAAMQGIEGQADAGWKAYLESTGRSDCLYAVLRPSGAPRK